MVITQNKCLHKLNHIYKKKKLVTNNGEMMTVKNIVSLAFEIRGNFALKHVIDFRPEALLRHLKAQTFLCNKSVFPFIILEQLQ